MFYIEAKINKRCKCESYLLKAIIPTEDELVAITTLEEYLGPIASKNYSLIKFIKLELVNRVYEIERIWREND